jgi:hypothetical protein
MKKSELKLFTVAVKALAKYGQQGQQSLQEIIENAAGAGQQSVNGIMNFPAQLKKDQADLTIDVTISSGLVGGKSIVVDPPLVEPVEMAANYARLPDQIKVYLERNLNGFPQIPTGTTVLRYSGKTPGSDIARN